MENQQEKRTVKSINPATNAVVKEFEYTGKEQVKKVLERANDTFKSWKKASFDERAEVLSKASLLMQERSQELAKTCSIEMGKMFKEALGEIQVCTGILDYYAKKRERYIKR